MKKWAGLLLAFLLLLGATASAAVQIGDRAEDFSIVNSDGTVSTLSLMLAQKKAVCVYFWASWCDMSREELPVVQAMYDQYGEDCGFIVASVEAEDTVSTVEALKQTLGLTTLPMGTGGLDAFLSYEQPGIPFSVLIDADGTVRAMHLGVATAEGRLDALDDIRKKSLFGQPFRAPKGLFAWGKTAQNRAGSGA